jgi:Uncharacterized conserved protein
MVLVPSGCFEMGSSTNEIEEPVHQICFDQPYWIDKMETSYSEYQSVVGTEDLANIANADLRVYVKRVVV